jgi:hypothetical protein
MIDLSKYKIMNRNKNKKNLNINIQIQNSIYPVNNMIKYEE